MQNKQLTRGKRKNACEVTQAFMLKIDQKRSTLFPKKRKKSNIIVIERLIRTYILDII